MKILTTKRFNEIRKTIMEMMEYDIDNVSGESVYVIADMGYVLEEEYESLFIDLQEQIQFEVLFILSLCENEGELREFQDSMITIDSVSIYLTTLL
mgnify:CR=1 FL=1